jgi:hypothetical protein
MGEAAKGARVVPRPSAGEPWVDLKFGDVIIYECTDRKRAEKKADEINAALSKSFVPKESHDRLREALERYGHCEIGCPAYGIHTVSRGQKPPKCECGFLEALNPPEGKP